MQIWLTLELAKLNCLFSFISCAHVNGQRA